MSGSYVLLNSKEHDAKCSPLCAWFLPRWWVEFKDELTLLFTNRFSSTRYMKVKRMKITEILRRIWLFSANKIKCSESVSKQPIQLIAELNTSLRQKLADVGSSHVVRVIEQCCSIVFQTGFFNISSWFNYFWWFYNEKTLFYYSENMATDHVWKLGKLVSTTKSLGTILKALNLDGWRFNRLGLKRGD